MLKTVHNLVVRSSDMINSMTVNKIEFWNPRHVNNFLWFITTAISVMSIWHLGSCCQLTEADETSSLRTKTWWNRWSWCEGHLSLTIPTQSPILSNQWNTVWPTTHKNPAVNKHQHNNDYNDILLTLAHIMETFKCSILTKKKNKSPFVSVAHDFL